MLTITASDIHRGDLLHDVAGRAREVDSLETHGALVRVHFTDGVQISRPAALQVQVDRPEVQPPAPVWAVRTTQAAAGRAFAAGATIVVADRRAELVLVTPETTVHTRDTTTFPALLEQVRMWRNRYPSQRFYVLEADTAAVAR